MAGKRGATYCSFGFSARLRKDRIEMKLGGSGFWERGGNGTVPVPRGRRIEWRGCN
jgi:hypothetical protein